MYNFVHSILFILVLLNVTEVTINLQCNSIFRLAFLMWKLGGLCNSFSWNL